MQSSLKVRLCNHTPPFALAETSLSTAANNPKPGPVASTSRSIAPTSRPVASTSRPVASTSRPVASTSRPRQASGRQASAPVDRQHRFVSQVDSDIETAVPIGYRRHRKQSSGTLRAAIRPSSKPVICPTLKCRNLDIYCRIRLNR